jgi:hypothetical protein
MAGFTMVPVWLLDLKPSGDAILIYCTLARHGTWNPGTGTYEECRPSMTTMVEMTGRSESSIRRAQTELLELGAIERRLRYREDASPLPSVYRVLFGSIVAPGQTLSPVDLPPVTGGPTPPSTGEPTLPPPVTGELEPNTQNQEPKNSSSAVADQESTEAPETADEEAARLLCEHLAKLMVTNGCKPPTITKAWLTDARLMITKDGRDRREAWRLISWCQADSFWRSNILSMPKFRQQYDKLRQRAELPINGVPQQRQEFKSSAEKKAEADARDRAKAKIGDALFAQLGRSINSMTEPEKQAFWAKVDEIYEDQVRGRSAPGYTGVVDAEVISEYTVQEVTGHAAG